MARIRTFKPEFFRHEKLQELESEHIGKYPMFVFEGLWILCDKQGVFPYKPKQIKLDILPFLNFDMAETLDILVDAGFIQYFISEDGNEYGFIPTFLKHQRISGEEAKTIAKYPTPPNTEAGRKQDGSRTEKESCPSRPGKGNGVKEREKERERSAEETVFLSFPVPEKKDQEEPLPEEKSKTKEDVTAVFQKARDLWNKCQLKPECRDLIIPPAQYDCLLAFQNYSWDEIQNSIRNYDWHVKGRCGPGYARPPPYGSIYGFLKTGVARYFDDSALDMQFKEPEAGHGGRR